MSSEISDNGDRFQDLGSDFFNFFFSLLKFSSQIYTDLGGACGAQVDEIK